MNRQTRILGLDFGERNIGVAISDPLGLTAQPLKTITYKGEKDLWTQLDEIFATYTVEKIVLGLPVHMHGERSRISARVEEFAEALRNRYRKQVILWDERLSSKVAEDAIRNMGKRPRRQREKVDLISAIWILQGYLNRIAFQKQETERKEFLNSLSSAPDRDKER